MEWQLLENITSFFVYRQQVNYPLALFSSSFGFFTDFNGRMEKMKELENLWTEFQMLRGDEGSLWGGLPVHWYGAFFFLTALFLVYDFNDALMPMPKLICWSLSLSLFTVYLLTEMIMHRWVTFFSATGGNLSVRASIQVGFFHFKIFQFHLCISLYCLFYISDGQTIFLSKRRDVNNSFFFPDGFWLS